MDNPRSFKEFWPYYLTQHSNPRTRTLHFAGTLIAVGCVIAMLVLGEAKLIVLGVIAAYAFAWAGHYLFERNHPATFRHPLWSLRADFRMLRLWLSGRLEPELRKAGVLVSVLNVF
jgi:hypothetical protein